MSGEYESKFRIWGIIFMKQLSVILYVFLLLMSLLTSSTSAFVQNGDFETGDLANWTVSAGSVDIESTSSLAGSYSAIVGINDKMYQDFISSGNGYDNLAGWTLDFMVSFDNLTGNERLRVRSDGNAGNLITLKFDTGGILKYSAAYGWNRGVSTTLMTDTLYYVRVVCGNLDADADPEFRYGISTDGSNYTFSGIAGAFHSSSSFVLANPFETITFEGGSDGGIIIDNVSVFVTNTIFFSETAGNTKVYESGETTDSISIWLSSAPTGPVTVSLSELTDPNQVTLDKVSLTFDSSNYDIPQTVTITAIDDTSEETYTHTAIIAFTTSSSDPDYNDLEIDDLTVTVVDNETEPNFPVYSGIYPHLAVTNTSPECGIGAVVNWADSLWFVTYAPHKPTGSDDGLYQLTSDLDLVKRPESIGGTPANRLIHTETNQLAIGSYIIDSGGTVHTIPLSTMPGRMTACARHLTEPANKVYFITMEEGIYEVDMNTYSVTELHKDTNVGGSSLVPGYHGKGAYTGQGRLVITNNGLKNGDGVLAEWDGAGDPGNPSSWVTVDENNYTDVTGPGGIYGNADINDPLWAIGWDTRSVLLNVCDNSGVWKRYRIPKASYTHDADQGWFTEWPRIRPVFGKYLMTMHGMIWDFPATFSHGNTAGIRPIASHLKMIVDFEEWNEQLVLGCNDASSIDSGIIGKSQSNLRFTAMNDLDDLGVDICSGGVWVNDAVTAGQYSEPYLLAGFEKRLISFSHDSLSPVHYTIEVDLNGDGTWSLYDKVTVPSAGYNDYAIPQDAVGEWIRFKTDANVTTTVYLNYSNEKQDLDMSMLDSLPKDADNAQYSAGLIRPRNVSDLTLSFSVDVIDPNGSVSYTGYYEVDGDMNFVELNDSSTDSWFRNTHPTTKDFNEDNASVKYDYDGITYRIPKNTDPFYSNPVYSGSYGSHWPRGLRHIVTEREMMNIHGTFYEVPHWRSGGKVKIRPICTHNRKIFDYCSWRGMLVLSGNFTEIDDDDHYRTSDDGKVGLWFGNVDDLYKMGIPRGTGGPWKSTAVTAGLVSDPYLMYGYEKKIMELSHDHSGPVTFTVEVDIAGTKTWSRYDTFTVASGQILQHEFPAGYHAHWVRVKTDTACTATAWFMYNPLHDGQDGLNDFAQMARRWLDVDCGYCRGVDLTADGSVNFEDFFLIGKNWLK